MATATNTAAITFPVPNAAGQDPTHVTLKTASTGGDTLWVDSLDNNPDAYTIGATVAFQASQFSITITASGNALTDDGATACLNSIIAGTRYVALHMGDPGANGTANELTGSDYARVAIASTAWTVT